MRKRSIIENIADPRRISRDPWLGNTALIQQLEGGNGVVPLAQFAINGRIAWMFMQWKKLVVFFREQRKRSKRRKQ